MQKLLRAFWYALTAPLMKWWGWLYLIFVPVLFVLEFMDPLLPTLGFMLLGLGAFYLIWASWTVYLQEPDS